MAATLSGFRGIYINLHLQALGTQFSKEHGTEHTQGESIVSGPPVLLKWPPTGQPPGFHSVLHERPAHKVSLLAQAGLELSNHLPSHALYPVPMNNFTSVSAEWWSGLDLTCSSLVTCPLAFNTSRFSPQE
ncbi:hypothetical protein H671_2g4638 [Cricetulus griseus]|nr:hypothetical protein H671_2g4638 [Cricetulus griseus]